MEIEVEMPRKKHHSYLKTEAWKFSSTYRETWIQAVRNPMTRPPESSKPRSCSLCLWETLTLIQKKMYLMMINWFILEACLAQLFWAEKYRKNHCPWAGLQHPSRNDIWGNKHFRLNVDSNPAPDVEHLIHDNDELVSMKMSRKNWHYSL